MCVCVCVARAQPGQKALPSPASSLVLPCGETCFASSPLLLGRPQTPQGQWNGPVFLLACRSPHQAGRRLEAKASIPEASTPEHQVTCELGLGRLPGHRWTASSRLLTTGVSLPLGSAVPQGLEDGCWSPQEGAGAPAPLRRVVPGPRYLVLGSFPSKVTGASCPDWMPALQPAPSLGPVSSSGLTPVPLAPPPA